MAEKNGEWLTHRDVASMMGVHPDTVHRWVEQGNKSGTVIIPHYAQQYGIAGRRRIRFKRSEIEQHIAQNTRSHNFGEGMGN